MSKRIWRQLLATLIIVALVVGAGFYAYKYNQAQKNIKQLKANPQQAVVEATNNLIKEIGSIVELPAGETPTVATVSDITKLKDQPFFAKAQNGDKVLIYTGAKEAILYRPSIKKIIQIAPVNIGNNTTSQPATGR